MHSRRYLKTQYCVRFAFVLACWVGVAVLCSLIEGI